MPPKNNHEAGKDAVEEGLQVSPRPNQSKKVMTVAQRLLICVRQQRHIKKSRCKSSCQCWQISSTNNTSRMVNVQSKRTNMFCKKKNVCCNGLLQQSLYCLYPSIINELFTPYKHTIRKPYKPEGGCHDAQFADN